MKQVQNVLTNCPPYLLFMGGFTLAVSYGLVRLYGMLQEIGLGA